MVVLTITNVKGDGKAHPHYVRRDHIWVGARACGFGGGLKVSQH